MFFRIFRKYSLACAPERVQEAEIEVTLTVWVCRHYIVLERNAVAVGGI
jgi:hypothetical protein